MFFDKQTQTSIEDGYLILTMMPSLFCELKCPHCYLSKEQRADETRMRVEDVAKICDKIVEYYELKGVEHKTVVLYWYGGEPTSMPMDYFEQLILTINDKFSPEKGYTTKHVLLSSLVGTSSDWYPFIKKYCDGHVQTSYDGVMRGRQYMRDWELKVREAQFNGLTVSTLSVVNSEMLKMGARAVSDYLNNLGITDAGFLPFMLNEQNKGKKYDTFAPTMDNWSSYLIELSEYYLERREAGEDTFEVGQLQFVVTQGVREDPISNIAAQTLFLMPNGDLSLPDYHNGYEEFLRPFGNALESNSFAEVINSPERLGYLLKQMTKNNNEDCLACDAQHKCVMEFWKDNKSDDDCFGGLKFVRWVEENQSRISKFINGDSLLC